MKERDLIIAIWRTNRLLPMTVILLLVINLALFSWLNWEQSPRVEALERKVINLQAQSRRMEGDADFPRTLPQIFKRGQDDFATFRQAMPPKTEFTKLISEVLSTAEKSGLSIQRISYDPKELKQRGVLEYALTFGVTGDYSQLKKFVFSLEQSPRLISIEDISLTEGGSPKNRGVSLKIDLVTYFRSDRP